MEFLPHPPQTQAPPLQQRVVSVEELAADWRLFEAFQWATGVGEALHVLSRPADDAPSAAAEGESGTAGSGSNAAPQEKATLKFKGWDGSSKWSSSHRRRIAKALSGVLPESFRALLGGLSESADDEEEDALRRRSPTVRLEVKDVGLVVAHLDVLIVKEPRGKGHPPPHNGLTMMDDVAAVLELCTDEAAMEGDAQRRLFVKTVLANLSKEAPIPVFLTDLLHCAIKASIVRGLRGVPLVVYERLSLDAFARELQLPKKTTVAHKAVAETLRRFKYGWVLPLGRCRIPFGDLSSRAMKTSGAVAGSVAPGTASVSSSQNAEPQLAEASPASNVSSQAGGASPGAPSAKKRGRGVGKTEGVAAKAEIGHQQQSQSLLLSKKEGTGGGASQETALLLPPHALKTEVHRSLANKGKTDSQLVKLNGAEARASSAVADSSSSSSSEDEAKVPPSKKGKKMVGVGSSAKLLGSPQINRQMPPSLAAVSGNNSDGSYESSEAE